jgi:hypothetical protein
MNKAKAKDKIYMGCRCYEKSVFICSRIKKGRRPKDLQEFFFVPFFPFLSLGSSWQGGNGREKERESAWENGGSAVLNTNLEYLCVIRALR